MSFSSGTAKSSCVTLVGVCWLLGGCLPPALAKYRDQGVSKKSDTLAVDPLAPSPHGDETRSRDEGHTGQGNKAPSEVGGKSLGNGQGVSHPEPPGIYAINPQTFRIAAKDEDVWDALLDVLLKHYTLTIVDRYSGIIATEWDTFMRGSVAYRNKLSLRLRKSGRNTVDLTIRNSVERLRGLGEGGGALGGVWLSSEDPGQEVKRVVQNLAILLDLPPPVFPPETLSSAPSAKASL